MVADSMTGLANRASATRVFYSDKGQDYLLVGVPWSWIDGAPVGDLIIDPTTSVATSEDVWLESTSNKDANSAGLLIGKAADPYPKKRTIIPSLPRALAGQASLISLAPAFQAPPRCSTRR